MQLKCLHTWHFCWTELQRLLPFYSNCLYSVELYRCNHWLKFIYDSQPHFWMTGRKSVHSTSKIESTACGKNGDALFCIVKSSWNWLIIISNPWHWVRKCVKFHFPFRYHNRILSEKVHWSNQSKQSFKLLSHHARLACLNKNQTEFGEKA